MKKLLCIVALGLLCNPIMGFAPFEAKVKDVSLKVTDFRIPIDLIAKIGANDQNFNPINAHNIINATIYNNGLNPIELDITNNSTQSYRLGLNSILAKAKTDYREVYQALGSLSNVHTGKVVGLVTVGFVGILATAYFLAASIEVSRYRNQDLGILLGGIAGISSLATLATIPLLVKVEKDSRELGMKFAKKFLQPEEIIIQPGQRIRLFAFLTTEAYHHDNFILSLVNHEKSDDIVSFNVPLQ